MLKNIFVTNFAGFEKFRIDLEPFTLLVGPNNGGKTSILRAIKIVHDALTLAATKNGQISLHHLVTQHPPHSNLQQTSGRISGLDPNLLRYKKRLEVPTTIELTYADHKLGGVIITATIPQDAGVIRIDCALFDLIRQRSSDTRSLEANRFMNWLI